MSLTQTSTRQTDQRTQGIPWLFFALIAGVCYSAIGIGLLQDTSWEEGWRYANRYLVRIGLPLFILSFIASSMYRLWPGTFTRYLRKQRRYLGLGFVLAHFTHLFAIFMFYYVSDESVDPVTLVGGGSTYVLIGLMALTSNRYSVKKLGRYWSRLHKTGAYSIWIVFTVSYVGRIQEQGLGTPFTILVLILFAALGLRMWASLAKRKPTQSTAVTPG